MEKIIWFSDWFDVYNTEHMKAFRYYQKYKIWPKGFKPDNIVIDYSWWDSIHEEMAQAWIELSKSVNPIKTIIKASKNKIKELILSLCKSCFVSGYIMGKGGGSYNLIQQAVKSRENYNDLLSALEIESSDEVYSVLSCG